MSDLLDEVYGYLEGAVRYDRYICSLCPIHDDHRPSFFVYEDGYYCKSCGAKGKTINLLDDIRKKQGVFIQKKQIEFHSPWSRWFKVFGDLNNTIKRCHDNLIQHNKTAYLRKRGIEIETIKKLKIGWMDDWITFPIYDIEHNLVGATARAGETNTTTSKYCNVPGMNPNLLYVPSWKMIEYKDKIFMVFGIIDAITLFQMGYASISTTTGKRTDPTALDNIRKQIFIIPDKGEEVEAALLSAKLSWRGKAIKVGWPDGCKDVNDLYLHNRDALINLVGV